MFLVVVSAAAMAAAQVSTAATTGGGSRRITKAQFGTNWPLTVLSGTLGCTSPPFPGAVTFTTNSGTTYWVNGTAGDSASQHGWRNIRPIWARVRHPLFPGQRKDIGVLIDAGLRLCG
jgi:hypothetical protein